MARVAVHGLIDLGRPAASFAAGPRDARGRAAYYGLAPDTKEYEKKENGQ